MLSLNSLHFGCSHGNFSLGLVTRGVRAVGNGMFTYRVILHRRKPFVVIWLPLLWHTLSTHRAVQLAAKTKQNGRLQNGIRGVRLATGIRPQRKREERGLPPSPRGQASWDGDHMQILLFCRHTSDTRETYTILNLRATESLCYLPEQSTSVPPKGLRKPVHTTRC